VLGGAPDGLFEHPPEPLEANLAGLCQTVRSQGADVGFAQDPDADRLAIVDNNGRCIGEELTLALCADYVLARTPGPIVVNGSTSRVTADVAARHGCSFSRSHVGEAHVVKKMKAVSAVLGGEGNGGVIEPKVGYVRDSLSPRPNRGSLPRVGRKICRRVGERRRWPATGLAGPVGASPRQQHRADSARDRRSPDRGGRCSPVRRSARRHPRGGV
jgi:hypothetical protein